MTASSTGSSPSVSATSRTRFPADQLRVFIKTLLAKTLATAVYDSSDRARMSAYTKEICERVKQKMMDLEPTGFKFIVTSTLSENLGQAGRADLASHWEDSDVAVQEMYSNDSLMFVLLAFAVRA